MERRRKREPDESLVLQTVFGVLAAVSLGLGGLSNFVPVFLGLTSGLIAIALVFGMGILIVRSASKPAWARAARPSSPSLADHFPAPSRGPAEFIAEAKRETGAVTGWTRAAVAEQLRRIDWYQFEKFSAALLTAEGWLVERRGGAHPDGGSDLVATHGGRTLLVQCKAWRTWLVPARVVREMSGSLSLAGAPCAGAVHTLMGFSGPAVELARKAGITLSDGEDLARRALASLEPATLSVLLREAPHLCPKCDLELVLRTGDFPSFWGCPAYPRCDGIIRPAG